ncbi:MAG: dihydropteroate synthase [Deltaproteobacteria bacterium]|nr:dihydropteroate synthase [Deltaproteobacteria bacterium]
MSKTYGPAMKNRDPKPIQELAVKLTGNGADLLDLNLGPARKNGPEMMDWLVRTVQEVTDLPLYLDTTNVSAIEAGLKAYKPKKGPAVINSISAVQEQMEKEFPLVKEYDCEFVGLMYSKEGIPRDENERGVLASEMMMKMDEFGLPLEKAWFDPVVIPVSSQQIPLQGCTNFIGMVKDIAPGSKTTCGLSNVSNGAPGKLRPILNQTYMALLINLGLYGAIVDGLDMEMNAFCKDKRQDVIDLVGKVLREEEVDKSSLSEEEMKYYKSARVLLNKVLYSDSWLDL